jgi:hypothetical protein
VALEEVGLVTMVTSLRLNLLIIMISKRRLMGRASENTTEFKRRDRRRKKPSKIHRLKLLKRVTRKSNRGWRRSKNKKFKKRRTAKLSNKLNKQLRNQKLQKRNQPPRLIKFRNQLLRLRKRKMLKK